MSNYEDWMDKELADYLREIFHKGMRVRMSKKWTKIPRNHKKPGVVKNFGRKDRKNLVIVHDGEKTTHTYHWSFIVPAGSQGEPKK